MEQFTEKEAIAFAKNEGWKEMTHKQRAAFQLYHGNLCMPFNVFHESIEKALGRPVYTHEFGLNWDGLKAELLGEVDAPTLKQVIDMIPEEKRIIVAL